LSAIKLGFKVGEKLVYPNHGVTVVEQIGESPVFDPVQASSAQAIVVLGGGTRRNAPEYGGDTLGALTLERLRYGTVVARVTHLPMLLSGGAVAYAGLCAGLFALAYRRGGARLLQ